MSTLWIFGDDVNTDQIVPGRFAPYMTSEAELRRFPFIEARPEFPELVQPGDVIVAGPNFGCGSSREYAAQALALCELGAILAPSFARIFYRNALNLGLPLIEVPAEELSPLRDRDPISLDLDSCELRHANGRIALRKPASFTREIWQAGGLIPYFQRTGHFPGEVAL
mgnify:FL=1|jgi:methanogen homoaconitase small subunit